ncbi:MAG: leucyl aminopeptidase [Candidatus Brocadiales bacterium]
MRLTVRYGTLVKERAEIIVLGLFDAPQMDSTPKGFDKALGGMIARLIKSGDFRPELNKTFLLPTYGHLPTKRLLLIGLGKKSDFTLDRVRQAAGVAIKVVRRLGIKGVTSQLYPQQKNPVEQVSQAMVEGTMLGLYRFKRFKHLKPEEARDVKALTIVVEDKGQLGGARAGARKGQLVAEAVCYARNLINLPGSQATPRMLADEAKKAGSRLGFGVKVLSQDAMKRLGMNGLLSVASGSIQPPRFIVLEYGKKRPGWDTVVLVGKGVTFDTGGISLKPWRDMDKMKYDMAGAATVLGAFGALARLRPRVHLVGLLPCAENMPGGRAVKPGDIVSCMGGKTVEIVTTDAEGRLLLADALVYARRYKPAAVMDLATLTGACIVALGYLAIGMLGNSEELKKRVKVAGDATRERVWEMPLWEEYGESVRSDVADVKNVGDYGAGVITGAKFLEQFVDKFPWVHLDIAGVAWANKDGPYVIKGASGTGVRLLVELITSWKRLPARGAKK